MGCSEYDRYDALGLAGLVRAGQVTPLELVDEAIDRIERVNPRINAVVHRCFEQARSQARGTLPDGPFRGVPFLVKDLLQALPGLPLSMGSRYFHATQPAHTSELVSRYQKSGLIVLGRTNTPEFGILPYTEPELHGVTRNPWSLEHTPGGSSGGSAAAVAAGIVPAAHGGDGGGSIRIPASCTGLFGLKPTRGRNPLGPDLGDVWHGLVVEHVLTRSVRDSAAMLDVTRGMDPGAPYDAPAPARPYLEEVGADPGRLRVAFTVDPMLGKVVDPGVAEAIRDTARLLESLGHTVEEACPEGLDYPGLAMAYLTIVAAELAALVFHSEAAAGRKPAVDHFELATWILALIGRKYSAEELARAVMLIQRSSRQVARWFERYDVLLTPTLAAPPVRVGELHPKPWERASMHLLRLLPLTPILKAGLKQIAATSFDWVSFTPIFNMTGQPAMSVPLWWTAEGLPVGSHFVGRFGDEATLFRLAGQLEQARPWAGRTPPVHAGPG